MDNYLGPFYIKFFYWNQGLQILSFQRNCRKHCHKVHKKIAIFFKLMSIFLGTPRKTIFLDAKHSCFKIFTFLHAITAKSWFPFSLSFFFCPSIKTVWTCRTLLQLKLHSSVSSGKYPCAHKSLCILNAIGEYQSSLSITMLILTL